jgi:hypothetical protein
MTNALPKVPDKKCPHHFAQGEISPLHYCTYIEVSRLLRTLPECLLNAEDCFLYSHLSTSVIWMNLLKADLQ